MRVSIVMSERQEEDYIDTCVIGVYRDSQRAWSLAANYQEKNPGDAVYVIEEEVLDDPS